MSHLDQEFRRQHRERHAAQSEEIQACLEGLLRRGGVAGSMVIDAAGHPIAASGDLSTQDPDLLVALSSASYSALAQVFSALGNGAVTHLKVSGNERGFSVLPMGHETLLLVSWDVAFSAPELDDWHEERALLTGLLKPERN
ncbi:MAG TPA: roadblock/LC7 domain-containing protein [Planctomycetes bacterium]|nr:roadblock/LC7 domain-containing protein [Planctomycetota bacterium]HIK60864.1 roadblock/LC7 domain-containing protein [Planctomycetota bacterium]